MQKDVDKVEINAETGYIADALNAEFLNVAETEPRHALARLNHLSTKMIGLRQRITEFKYAQRIINAICRERGLVEPDQMKELRLVQFQESDRVENSLADYGAVWRARSKAGKIRDGIYRIKVGEFDRSSQVIKHIVPLLSQLDEISTRFKNAVITSTRNLLNEINLIADLVWLLKHEDVIGSYRWEVERLFPGCRWKRHHHHRVHHHSHHRSGEKGDDDNNNNTPRNPNRESLHLHDPFLAKFITSDISSDSEISSSDESHISSEESETEAEESDVSLRSSDEDNDDDNDATSLHPKSSSPKQESPEQVSFSLSSR